MLAMLALRQRCCAAARAASKSFYQGRHEQKKQVVEEMMAVVELPCSTWRPHTPAVSPFSRPMLLLAMRGAKRCARPSTAPASIKPQKPRQQNNKQHSDVNSTSDLLVRWEIPWDGKRVVITVTAIVASYVFSGLVPAVVLLKLGKPLNPDEKSILLFTSILLQTIVITYVMKACIKSYSPLPKELFSYDWRNPFSARRGWLLWGIVGIFCAVAAVVPVTFLTNSEAFSMDRDVLLRLQPLIGASGTSTALLLASLGVLVPFVEETIFRGFLLTSLTKWVPTYVAVLMTAGAFTLVHFNPGKSPIIFALGVMLGFSYSKTGNLLTPIMIHGVWNSAMILALTFLHRLGYDIRKLLESQEIPRHWRAVQTPDCAGKK